MSPDGYKGVGRVLAALKELGLAGQGHVQGLLAALGRRRRRLETPGGGHVELYRPGEDRAEANNPANESPDVVRKLSAKLAAWKASLPKEPPPECISKGAAGTGGKRPGRTIELR